MRLINLLDLTVSLKILLPYALHYSVETLISPPPSDKDPSLLRYIVILPLESLRVKAGMRESSYSGVRRAAFLCFACALDAVSPFPNSLKQF